MRLRRPLPSGPRPGLFPGVRVTARGIAPRSLSCSRGGSGDPAHRRRESAGAAPAREAAAAGASAPLAPGRGSAVGCFLGLSLATASAFVCRELLSELLPASGALTPTDCSCSWSRSGQQYPMPLKQPEKSPLPSQIPGLSDLSRAPHEVPQSGCHGKCIKETDSACLRLAKQGGRPDLLKHYTPVVMKSPPAAYAAPDHYLHCASPAGIEEPWSCVLSLPDYVAHRELMAGDRQGNRYGTRRGPSDLDTKSVWQREAENKENAEEKRVKLPPIRPKYPSKLPTVSTNKEFSGANKLSFPPMPAQRKNEAVNFSKLISNGYGTDWFHPCTGWEKKIEETSENSEHSKDSERSESPPASNELKPSFQGYNK
ncbi:uncharacterized protein C7orf57 homolog [Prinia subflava]|uniref:uncharacterized protein C7orf57 homolog n=1 Tax=Prinia subflava TaxID=208062 RepID=UPI002FE397DC